VYYDEHRATVTTSVKTASALQQQLRAVGIIATEVGLRGRFHWENHRDDIETLIAFCDSHPEFQFPDASRLLMPTRSNSGGDFITHGPLHHDALRSILGEASHWYQTFAAVRDSQPKDKDSLIVSFGPERCVPPSIMRGLSPQVFHMMDLDQTTVTPESSSNDQRIYSDNDIAVVGMSCKVAGADNLEEFWDLLCKGKSQHKEVPKERFGFESVYRDVDPKRKWYGNFIDDHDMFDHKFFKKSPREIASTDPQQRHILQIAYQAVEQSGYFHSPNADKRVGCYVGVCAVDYENNVACHPPNAFSATGNLKGFIAGKISHYFGWTGPGLTIDTACSSSAVAVHQACRAIHSGDCDVALAGGTHVMTNPIWFQNLAGASFLSPTGQCKPFDAKADGYCRGEGVAAVFLKRMSTAIADGDQILGTIASTAVQQNQNCTPIFVPNTPSLSDLFRVVTHKAGLKPQQITVVEAHGTGTVVGDPAEYESVRQVLGGSIRSKPLMLSSVKGLVGHIECTSGLISLIKILLMIRKGAIPPQASFSKINSAIKSSPADNMSIPTSLQPWDVGFRAALINNYGASGSNASMVVTQAPRIKPRASPELSVIQSSGGIRYPFWFCGLDDRSLRAYSTAFRRFLRNKSESAKDLSLTNLAFNVFRQSNRSLDRGLMFSCRSIDELEQKLIAYENGDPTILSVSRQTTRPLIFCFGGQVSTFVGLDRQVYETVTIFRKHLDECNSVGRSIGAGSIYPGIFQRTPIEDPVKLQTMLFAIQYSCAKSWMDCGAQPVSVLGYSFGEMTALCISGVLTLEDAMRMIVSRASIIQESWGPEKGAMMAVQADFSDVERLLDESTKACNGEPPATIACFNGPRSFTLAGSSQAIDAVAATIPNHSSFSSMRSKRLNVSNAFHSILVEPLMASLEHGAQSLTFRAPSIPLERPTEFASQDKLTPRFVAEHMRHPVYFNHAVQRLAKQYPSSIWLEAGSNSTITTMASRALASTSDSHFQSVNITSDNAMSNLADATLSLWKTGLNVSCWEHHASQTSEYAPILLPPYQFDKARHWLELKKPPTPVAQPVVQPEPTAEKLPDSLLTFAGYQDSQSRCARFRVNTMIPKYERLLAGHIIAQTAPICPATVQVGLAIEALRSLQPNLVALKLEPQIHGVDNQSPLCIDPARSVWLDLEGPDREGETWSFKVSSTGLQKGSANTSHTTGEIVLCSIDKLQLQLELARYERLVGHQRCLDVLESHNADDIIQGRNIYKTFAEIVDYGEDYRGLQKLVGKGNESAGHVVKKYNPETWLDAHLSDSFCQVGGIWVNCMTDRDPTDMYIANGIEQWIRSPKLRQEDPRPNTWDVFATHHRPSDKAYLTDIFIFNGTTGALTEVILGISYVKVAKVSMSKLLSRLTAGDAKTSQAVAAPSKPAKVHAVEAVAAPTAPSPTPKPVKAPKPTPMPKKEKKKSSRSDVPEKVKAILAELSGLELHEIKDDSELANLGIDSLMGMELAREIEGVFKCSLPTEQLVEISDVPGLMRCVQAAVGPADDAVPEDEDDDAQEFDDYEQSSSDNPSVFTPSDSDTNDTSVAEADLVEYLAEFLGIEKNDLTPNIVLRDLGVDSLLATELRSDLATKFDVEISEHVAMEELTFEELDVKVNGHSKGAPKAVDAADPTKGGKEIAPLNGMIHHDNSGTLSSASGSLHLPSSTVLEAFRETKLLTDQFIADYRCADYVDTVMPKQTQMCIALTVEAFEQLGCSLGTARAGQKFERITHLREHGRLVDYLYQMLEKEARLINIDGDHITRTSISPPSKSSKEILQDLLHTCPDHSTANKLTYYTGSNLAQVLMGKSDGIKLIFGTEEGRELVSGLYGDWPVNRLYYKQMEDFLSRLVSKLPMHEGPLKILEMGSGTGGTTKWLVPLLASLNVPVEYTFTDLAPSFVAAARKKFKAYPFMKFRTHDIEKPPADDLINTQHIIIASNAVHATHSLTESTKNIHKFLRPDGFLMMLEMTGTLYWVDMIFGLFEGWWLFDDGRTHAVTNETRWERDLQSVGYGHVDWTDGHRPECKVERFFIAMASGSRYDRLPIPSKPVQSLSTDCAARRAVVEEYVRKKTQGFAAPVQSLEATSPSPAGECVLITGATGSLGSHLVAHFVQLPNVKTVVCLNRRSNQEPKLRQEQALVSKGIVISPEGHSKLQVFESDMGKPMLGLPGDDYESLLNTVTHVVHNAWLMSAKRPLKGFESQFQIMRNMIDLARQISCKRPEGFKITFQFISSIAVVGHYPLWSKNINVPEDRMTIESVLTNGYGDAKYVCELMLDETLHKYPDRFRSMAVRIGQIAGSKTSGYWNPMEHLSFLWKSSQTLKALPNFDGVLSWTPVDDVAATLGDLLLADNTPYPIYHIDNPVRQPWRKMIPVLADALDIPLANAIPFVDWVERVRHFPALAELDNPAAKLIDFLDENFVRMSCGGLLLDTAKTREHSKTLAAVGPVSDEVARKFVQAWKDMRFLS